MNWLMGHLIGDYLLQNDWMALNKKKASFPCTVHCLIWSLCVLLCARWPLWTLPVLFITHFAQDRTNIVVWLMNHKGQKQFAQPPMAPWSIIVVDNVLHMTVVWALSFAVRP
jgi:hypothetical protein